MKHNKKKHFSFMIEAHVSPLLEKMAEEELGRLPLITRRRPVLTQNVIQALGIPLARVECISIASNGAYPFRQI